MIEPLTAEAEIPQTGKKIKLRELDGAAELRAASEVRQLETPSDQTRLARARIFRSLVSIDGEPFDVSTSTSDMCRDQFSSKEWAFVMALFTKLHMPEVDEVDRFLEGITFGT
jgi:hypothetical protein